MDYLTPVLWIPLLAWAVAQGMKLLLGLLSGISQTFMATGGMPSGHAAFVGAATTVIALQQGPGSPLFGLAAIVCLVVIHDAIRLRWAVGQQAERLNALMTAAKMGTDQLVMVWRGHRIREVVAGLIIGVGVASAIYLGVY